MATCGNCHAEIPDGGRLCPHCGVDLRAPAVPVQQSAATLEVVPPQDRVLEPPPQLSSLASPQAIGQIAPSSTRQSRARATTNGFALAGGVIAFFALFPGSVSVALCILELLLCYRIGKIYLGDEYSLGDEITSYAWVFLAALAGQVVASILLEALTFVPLLGWAIKGGVAAAIIKILGSVLADHYEKVTV
jgi:uncharacterized protein (DUF697 family)